MDEKDILNQMQEQVRFLNDALEKYKHQFDQETLAQLSEELAALTQSIAEMDRELRVLQHRQSLKDNGQTKKD